MPNLTPIQRQDLNESKEINDLAAELRKALQVKDQANKTEAEKKKSTEDNSNKEFDEAMLREQIILALEQQQLAEMYLKDAAKRTPAEEIYRDAQAAWILYQLNEILNPEKKELATNIEVVKAPQIDIGSGIGSLPVDDLFNIDNFEEVEKLFSEQLGTQVTIGLERGVDAEKGYADGNHGHSASYAINQKTERPAEESRHLVIRERESGKILAEAYQQAGSSEATLFIHIKLTQENYQHYSKLFSREFGNRLHSVIQKQRQIEAQQGPNREGVPEKPSPEGRVAEGEKPSEPKAVAEEPAKEERPAEPNPVEDLILEGPNPTEEPVREEEAKANARAEKEAEPTFEREQEPRAEVNPNVRNEEQPSQLSTMTVTGEEGESVTVANKGVGIVVPTGASRAGGVGGAVQSQQSQQSDLFAEKQEIGLGQRGDTQQMEQLERQNLAASATPSWITTAIDRIHGLGAETVGLVANVNPEEPSSTSRFSLSPKAVS